MKWNQRGSIVIRGSSEDNPDGSIAQANESEIGFDVLQTHEIPEGNTYTDAADNIDGFHKARYEILLVAKPVYGSFDQGTDWQTDGDYRKLQRLLLMDHAWIWRVYERGNDHGAGYFKWSDTQGEDYLWHPDDDANPGVCPLKVKLIGAPSISPVKNGLIYWEMNLKGYSIIS